MSKLWSLEQSDFIKGLIVAIGAGVITFLYKIVQEGGLSAIEFNQILEIAIISALAYLGKQLGTNSSGELGKAETNE